MGTINVFCVSRNQSYFYSPFISLFEMFNWTRSKEAPTSNNPSKVTLVKESYWRSLVAIKQSNGLYLCQSSVDPSKYEIIYRSLKIYSLCRVDELEIASARFNCIKGISDIMFHPMNPYRKASFIVTAFQKVIDTCIEHPNWLDIHVSAYNGFVDFFQKGDLNQDQINAQTEPDLCTPLHLAILRGFELTTKAILAFNPNINLLDSESSSILHYAALSKVQILDIILQLPDIRMLFSRNNKHWNPVELACFKMEKNNLQRMMTFGLTARMLTLIVEPGNTIEDNQQQFLDRINNEKIITFTRLDLDQMDFSCINRGGSPLHWALTRTMIERLLRDNFHIDTPNLYEETALCLAIKNNRFKIALSLLFNGADVNKPDSSGDAPLHIAVKNANVNLTRSLLVCDAEVNVKTTQGECVRHLAATGTEDDHALIVGMLNSIGAPNCQPEEGLICSTGCVATRISKEPHLNDYPLNLNPNHKSVINSIITPSSQSVQSLNERDKGQVKNKKVMLVNFDGGGIKGVFTVQMMIELSKYLQDEFRNYFDWISGTSTGAMIAFSLARGSTLTEMRKLYFHFKDEIMVGSRPYNATNLEALFQNEFDDTLRMGDMLSSYGKHVLIFATRIDCSPPSLQTFRSYFYPGQNPEDRESVVNLKAWKAIRASTAAPTYFVSFPPYIDGGFLANNPTMDSLTEFFRYQSAVRKYNQKSSKHKLAESELQLILSFGNGQIQPQLKDQCEINKLYCFFNLSSVIQDFSAAPNMLALKDQMQARLTNCNEHIVARTDSWCAAMNMPYFRITPLLSQKISLNETDDAELVRGLWEVKVYAHQKAKELRQLAQVIDCMHSARA